MRFAENNRISHRQLYRQMILALLAPFMLCVFGKGGMNGISAVAGMIFALILLGFYVIWLIRLTPSFEDPVKSAGAFAGRLIGIFFLIYVLMAGGYLLALLRRLVPVKLITGVSGRWIAFWAVLVCSVGTCKGVQRRGRISLFMEPCVLFRRLHCCHFCWEMWRNTEVRERRWQEGS